MKYLYSVLVSMLFCQTPVFANDASAVMDRLSNRYKQISRGKEIIKQRAYMDRQLERQNRWDSINAKYRAARMQRKELYNTRIKKIWDRPIEKYEQKLREAHTLEQGKIYEGEIEDFEAHKELFLQD